MLEEVRISGLGVIDDAILELSPGFNVVTGETGAPANSGEPGEAAATPRPDPFSLRPSHVRLMRSRSQCP